MPHSLNRTTRSAVTLVELLIVMVLIVIVMTIAVPGLAGMLRESRQSEAVQAVSSALQRAKYSAMQSRAHVAVRFVRGDWLVLDEEEGRGVADRQYLVLYRWKTATFDMEPTAQPVFVERFERVPDTTPTALPTGFWFAPLEALQGHERDAERPSRLALSVLVGAIGYDAFEYSDSSRNYNGDDLFTPDDFLIVFDEQGQIVPGPRVSDTKVTDFENGQTGGIFRLWAGIPPAGEGRGRVRETHREFRGGGTGANRADWWSLEPYERANFSGVVLYQRSDLLALGNEADPDERFDWLLREAQPYVVHPRSAVLIESQRVVR